MREREREGGEGGSGREGGRERLVGGRNRYSMSRSDWLIFNDTTNTRA